jgi:hypothetical protein
MQIILRNIVLCSLLITCNILNINAQDFTEVGGSFGLSSYLGDLTTTFGNPKVTHPGGGVFLRRTFAKGFLSARAGILVGTISGEDKYNYGNKYLTERNLNFRSPITELHFMGDLNLFRLNTCRRKNFTIYGSAGVALFRFDPTTIYYGDRVHLRDIGTEGQGIPLFPERQKYDLIQLSIPVAGGFKYILRKKIVICGEFGLRKTFTDYLDDISTNYVDPVILTQYNGEVAANLAIRNTDKDVYQYIINQGQRGNPKSKDWYYFGTFSVSYILKNNCSEEFTYGKYLKPRYNANTPTRIKGKFLRKIPILNKLIDCYEY